MKQLSHTFTTNYDYLTIQDTCLYCGLTAQQLFNHIERKFHNLWPRNEFNELQQQINYLNKYIKCLTEEEYIIKAIIE